VRGRAARPKDYSSSFGTRMHFNRPGPGWVSIGRPEADEPDVMVHEWIKLRTPDLIELADAAKDETKNILSEADRSLAPRPIWRDFLWMAWITLRRFLEGLRGRELVAYSGANVRWILAYDKDDADTRRLALQMLSDSREKAGHSDANRDEVG
jgi:hypothetical protein